MGSVFCCGVVGSRVISKRTDAGGSDVYAMYIDRGKLRFRLDGTDMISTTSFPLDQWTFVAMTYDGTDKKIYIDGQLDPTTPQQKTYPIDASTRPVHLGDRENQGRRINGSIDEVAIWNRALTSQEVQSLDAQGLTVSP